MNDPSATRVSLRPIEPGDIPVFFEYETDPASASMAGVIPRDRETFLAHWARVADDDTVIERAIVADGVLAGRVTCFLHAGDWTLGYWIGRAHWGRGIATRAVALFVQEVDRRPMLARVLATNAASIRILERHGFVRTSETDEPATERYIAGRVVDFELGAK